jgi:hypothetical protein
VSHDHVEPGDQHLRETATAGPARPKRRGGPFTTGLISSPGVALALQRAAGNSAVRQLLRPAGRHRNDVPVQRGFLDAIGDALDMRYNEKERDEYEDSMSELEKFRKGKPVTKDRHEPSSGTGKFDVSFAPGEGVLTLTVRCFFEFKDSLAGKRVDPASDPSAPRMMDIWARWTPQETQDWKARFFAQVMGVWKDPATFWCQRDWWEDLKATTRVQFLDEPQKDPSRYHFYVSVNKRGSMDKQRNSVRPHGSDANFYEEMLDPGKQPTGAHEAGHMLGLGDEYQDENAGPLLHDKLVKAQFGNQLVQGKGDPESLMAHGSKVLPEHSVTFFEALEKLTPNLTWARVKKLPRPAPATRPNYPVMGPMGPF